MGFDVESVWLFTFFSLSKLLKFESLLGRRGRGVSAKTMKWVVHSLSLPSSDSVDNSCSMSRFVSVSLYLNDDGVWCLIRP